MRQKTGWLEKWDKGRVASMVEVKYHRAGVKKTKKKKGSKIALPSGPDAELYYMLDKKASMGKLSLTGNSVFEKNEIVVVELYVVRYGCRLRLLGKIEKTTTFMELQRVVFRGDIHFAAVSKDDFDHLLALEDQRVKEEAKYAQPAASSAGASQNSNQRLKITFKRD